MISTVVAMRHQIARIQRACCVFAGFMTLGVSSKTHADPGDPPVRIQGFPDENGAGEPAPSARARRDDPPVDVVCKAAVALAMAEPERARGFISRARLAGWFPEMHFRVYRRFARTEGLTFSDTGNGTVAPVDISAIDDVRYEWRASWDLSRMVFNPDELQAHLETLRMSDTRRDIQSLVIKLYFERRRLLLEAPSSKNEGGTEAAAGAEKRFLRISELEAQLDALSGGAFSEGAASPRQAGTAP